MGAMRKGKIEEEGKRRVRKGEERSKGRKRWVREEREE